MSRRTIRRYAHELFPHGEEGETRPLAVEVPYLYARAIGMDTWGTSALDMLNPDNHPHTRELGYVRYSELAQARQLAFIADSLHQGLTGQDHHDHMASTGDVTGHGIVTRLFDCPESECPTCTEEES